MSDSKNINIISLTFEAGGDIDTAAKIVSLLKKESIRATVFLEGEWTARNPDIVRDMVANGLELGNHTYSHPNLIYLEDEQIRKELDSTDSLVTRLTGSSVRPWLRLPYAASDERVQRVVKEAGYRIIQRDAVDGGHWPGRTTPEKILSRTIEHIYSGAVVTYHLSNPLTLDILPQIISQLRDDGYKFVCLSDLPNVSEQEEKHSDFDVSGNKRGFLEVIRHGTPAWSMNLFDFATKMHFPVDGKAHILTGNNGNMSLMMGEQSDRWISAYRYDCYITVISGPINFFFRLDGEEDISLHILGYNNDLLLWPKGYELQLGKGPGTSKRWIILIIEDALLPD